MSNGRIIYYWSGVVGDESLREQYADVLEKLLNGDTNSVTCHKLKNCKGLYSVYADGKDRLIFTEKMINGKNCIVVLKSLPNHDYQKLDAKVLKRHVDRNSELFISQLEAQEEELKWEELDAAEVKKIFADGKSAQPDHLNFKSLEFFNQLFVELNIAQENAKHARFPLLISGAPGTGKSLVALLLLKKGEPGEKYCYVAKSSNLVNEMREQWGEMSAEMGELPYMVEFYTYDELLSKVSQELKLGLENKTWVDGAAFATWFSEYLKKKKGIFKTAGIEELVAKVTGNVDKVYQELKIVAVYGELQYVGSEEEKKQRVEGEQPCSRLGKRQSLFEVKEERALIWRIYSAYRDSLESKKQIDVALYSAESTSLFKRLIVDEAQDLSYAQLQVLYQLTDDIGLCMDSHQNIADYLSKRPFILSMLGEHATHIQLPVGYRCTQLMVDILNEWMRMGYEAVGGLSDADEYSKITLEDERAKKMGRTRYCADFARIPTIMRELKEKHGAAEMAVVIAEESMREEAIKIYGTEQVFTATEIKGLEYKAVIVHRLLDKDECKEINKRLQENVGNAKETINRPKNNDSHMDLSPAVCEVFTALSRATEELVLCQEDKHEMALIAERLKKKIPPADVYEKPKTQSKGKGKEKVRPVEQFVLTEVVLTELEIKAWLAKVVKLIKAGAIKQAHDVFTNTLKKSEAEYNAFYELHKPKTPAAQIPIQQTIKSARSVVPFKQPATTKKVAVSSSSVTSSSVKSVSNVSAKKSNKTNAKLNLSPQQSEEIKKMSVDELAIELLASGQDQLAQLNFDLGNTCFCGLGGAKKPQEAVFFYQLAARQGHTEAQYRLAVCYLEGIGVAKDPEKAVRLFQPAAKKGHTEAQHTLGVCYLKGIGVAKDPEKAVHLFQSAAKKGDIEARYSLVVCYSEGTGVAKDPKEAIRLLQSLAEEGYAKAQYNLGHHYFTGKNGDKIDLGEAVRLFQLAARGGYIDAQYGLGVCYLEGIGVAKDPEKAVRLFQSVAKQGHVGAQYGLGVCYLEGIGVAKDPEKAVRLLQFAAEKEHAMAQAYLGICYAGGIGIEKNVQEASRWIDSAVQNDRSVALACLKRLNTPEALHYIALIEKERSDVIKPVGYDQAITLFSKREHVLPEEPYPIAASELKRKDLT